MLQLLPKVYFLKLIDLPSVGDFSVLPYCNQLCDLELRQLPISIENNLLRNCRYLESITLVNCPRVTDLSAFERCSKLQSFVHGVDEFTYEQTRALEKHIPGLKTDDYEEF